MSDDAEYSPHVPYRPGKNRRRNPAVRKGQKGFLPGMSGNPNGRPKGSGDKSTMSRERIDRADEEDISASASRWRSGATARR